MRRFSLEFQHSVDHFMRYLRFSSEDSTYEKAVSECHSIKESSLFTEGLLLKCIDLKPLFPYLHFAHFSSPDYTGRTGEVTQVIRDCGASPNSQYGCYDEVYTIQKAATSTENRLPAHRHAGYIVIGFKLLDDASKPQALEKTWLQWSGAREIYKYSPRNWNLRRISLLRHPNVYRNGQPRPFAYVLLCEYSSILHPSNTVQALDMCERMRVRNCGHVALYQVHTAYNSLPQVPLIGQSSPRVVKRNPMLRGFSQDVESTESRRQKLRPMRDRSFGYMEEENFESFPGSLQKYDHYGSATINSLSPHSRSPQTYVD
ncbi:unnamed protein product, partial [Mesorhabditis belari]|uniref:DUF7153 domain-containing protein n=1 Tax=Mesorhabditis belari TaxID=2138241 RepID=A0AAF3FTZ7_9BILA